MHSDFTIRKRTILVAVGLLMAADLGLAFYSWQLSSGPRTPQQQLNMESLRRDVFRKDINQAQDIHDQVPSVRKQCDQFEQSLPPAGTGYSSISAELAQIAKKAGLQIVSLSFKQKEVANRGIAEVSIDAAVNGEYGSVVRFINGLQRSSNLYAVDGLDLATETQTQGAMGAIRLGIHVRTYFRAGT